MSDVVIPEVFAIFEKKVATLVSYDHKTERARWDEAVIDLLKFFESIIARCVETESQLAARDALIERLIDVAQKKFATSLPMNEQAITWGGKWMKLKTEWQAMKGGEK